MIPQEIIRRKRDGEVLSSNDIAAFIAAMTDETISEGQVAAFAMAVFFKGMSRDETIALTLAMRDSGRVLQWSDAGRPVADKHSTGGVGDNVSLMLAPILAACGAAVTRSSISAATVSHISVADCSAQPGRGCRTRMGFERLERMLPSARTSIALLLVVP